MLENRKQESSSTQHHYAADAILRLLQYYCSEADHSPHRTTAWVVWRLTKYDKPHWILASVARGLCRQVECPQRSIHLRRIGGISKAGALAIAVSDNVRCSIA